MNNPWDRSWEAAVKNIFEALRIKEGDRLALLFNSNPPGKEFLADEMLKLAKKRGVPAISKELTLDETFDISPLEAELRNFLKDTKNTQRKFFFTAAGNCLGQARRAVHKLISVDPDKFKGHTISLPTDDPDIISALADTSPNDLWARGERLKGILSKATKIRITSAKGTDLGFDWNPRRRKYLISAGFPHTHEDRWDNLGGEIFTAPIHNTVNGRLVIDGSIGHIGLVDGVIAVDIKNGRGKINRKESTASEGIIDELDKELNVYPCSCVVGEFGIGTTPGLKLCGELLNDEKVEGTIHIAFGDSYSTDGSGGENDCDTHTDCIVLSPTVEMTADGKVSILMSEGKFAV